MKYVERLLEDKRFREVLEELERLEADRIYCRHDFTHLMDVARIASREQLESGGVADEEQIYLAALLHDIGRAEEYKNGISHAIAGKKLAGEILLHIGYPGQKTEQILAVIEGHRGETPVLQEDPGTEVLVQLIQTADQKSRPCFFCRAADTCKWSSDRKNKTGDWR